MGLAVEIMDDAVETNLAARVVHSAVPEMERHSLGRNTVVVPVQQQYPTGETLLVCRCLRVEKILYLDVHHDLHYYLVDHCLYRCFRQQHQTRWCQASTVPVEQLQPQEEAARSVVAFCFLHKCSNQLYSTALYTSVEETA